MLKLKFADLEDFFGPNVLLSSFSKDDNGAFFNVKYPGDDMEFWRVKDGVFYKWSTYEFGWNENRMATKFFKMKGLI